MRKIFITTLAGSLLTSGAWLLPSHASTPGSSCKKSDLGNDTQSIQSCSFTGDGGPNNGWAGTLEAAQGDLPLEYAIYSYKTIPSTTNSVTTYTTTYDCVPQGTTVPKTTTDPAVAGSDAQGLAACGITAGTVSTPEGSTQAAYSGSLATPPAPTTSSYFTAGTIYTLAVQARNAYMEAGDPGQEVQP